MKTVYVFHCNICNEMVKLEDREKSSCPTRKEGQIDFSSGSYDGGYERRRFPYYDECLDRTLLSKQHQREVLKEMNLVQHDGHFSSGGGSRKEKTGIIYSFGGSNGKKS